MLDALTYFLVTGVLYTLPISVAIWFWRTRISRLAAGALLAVGFAGATAFSLWRMEWFDVWRHGVGARPFSYIATSYGPPMTILAAVGALIGASLVPRRPRSMIR